MPDDRESSSSELASPWPLVLSLVGVDYFSTLAYLPSMAVEAAGPRAPAAAIGVVVVTFAMALPVYWYVVGRSPEGRGATGMLEQAIRGWRGKLIVLVLLGFAAADFVITRSLSLADAAVHVLHNPRGQRIFAGLSELACNGSLATWPPLDSYLRFFLEPQMAVTIALTLMSLGLWQLLKRGLTQRVLMVTAIAVTAYLGLSTVVIGSSLWCISRHPELWDKLSHQAEIRHSGDGFWAWVSIALWSFPQMVLGLSGFEMIMTVVPRVRGTGSDAVAAISRIANTRKLMVVAASIMSLYLVSAVTVTTALVPHHELASQGKAQHRALAYLAHGSPLNGNVSLGPVAGPALGDLFDLATIVILCLAGATVTLGLQSLLPHYLRRLGMEVSWAGRVSAILHVLNLVVILVTVVFRASPSSQQWAYSTSVLVLLLAASLAAANDLRQRRLWLLMPVPAAAALFFLTMTLLTIHINRSGLIIALAFVVAIVVSSFISRWIRSTELRFEGFDFADDATRQRWCALQVTGAKVLVPHRPGRVSLAAKNATLQEEFRLDSRVPVIFIEATLGDPSNFFQRPAMKIEIEDGLEVIRVAKCVSISHVLAAICVELCSKGGHPPEIVFGWSHESPLAANLNFLLLGEGNIPWMVKDLVRKAMPNAARLPRVLIG